MDRKTVRNDVQMIVTCRLSKYLTFRPALCDVEHEAALQHPHLPSSSAGVAVYCTLCRYCVSTTGRASGSDPSFWLQRDCRGQNARRAERPTDRPGARAQLSAFTTGTQSQKVREPAYHMQHHAEHFLVSHTKLSCLQAPAWPCTRCSAGTVCRWDGDRLAWLRLSVTVQSWFSSTSSESKHHVDDENACCAAAKQGAGWT